MTRRISVREHPAWVPWAFAAPFLLVAGTFIVWPLVQSLGLSLEQSFGPAHTTFVGLRNFSYLLRDPLFWTALRNTALFAGGAVFLQLPVSLGLALLLNRPGLRGRTFFRLVFFAPALVGTAFAAMMFTLLFQIRTGLINTLLSAVVPGFDSDFAWLQEHVMAALILAALWLHAGFNMIYFLAALQNVPRELQEAASIDGANAWQRFRVVTLPQIRPVAGFVLLLSVIGSFQLFELPWVLLDSSPGPENRGLTIVMYLYQNGFLLGDLGYASAVGWVLALLLIGAAWIQRRLLARAEEAA